mmetsp:Transcript_28127/g.32235  ORF Transcript_28127/g.32235 Transcript_28127/m.32235 type:complete len:81 (+) Transcript_28127:391-633(+)
MIAKIFGLNQHHKYRLLSNANVRAIHSLAFNKHKGLPDEAIDKSMATSNWFKRSNKQKKGPLLDKKKRKHKHKSQRSKKK